jgi:UDP-N-acetylglucosamine 2-epimerase
MELSHYKHIRKERVKKRIEKTYGIGNARVEIAKQDFDTFAKSSITHFKGDLADFFTVTGKIPQNMHILKFEEISEAVTKLLAPFQNRHITFPHKNKSTEKVDLSMLSDDAILNIQKKYAWIYEQGFYPIPDIQQTKKRNQDAT